MLGQVKYGILGKENPWQEFENEVQGKCIATL